ncbi:hypothetical protein FPOAC2_12725 [Fusarium poae]|jgi:hypothetical protein|uniref:Siderophore biosynthesis enzyme n=1 Tax=Fusarium poae TaxID=36050 RepID=A0A1B8AGX1_FUSPO|nr:hypothetical protein FPOAC1_012389 [Fusarium poae]KAG8667556.1 hypothetical protein FPOAC1_012389 [Fusarium poae]OBS19778.1 hypothetical protein FPOA_11502 [Fusarium poae]
MASKFLALALAAAAPALAKTDLAGCTTYDTVVSNADGMYATRIWYVPDSGEICDLLDCGGGRAPPKTTVPGCPAYEGTETYSPLFINPKTLGGAAPTGASEETASVSATITSAPVTETSASGTATKTEAATETEAASETESKSESTVKPILSGIRKANDTVKSTAITTPGRATLTTTASSGAGSGTATSGSDSGSASDSESAASGTGTAVSTAGAAAMPTAGAFLALAGAAIYAGML